MNLDIREIPRFPSIMSSESVSMARQLVPLAKVIAMTSAGAAVGMTTLLPSDIET